MVMAQQALNLLRKRHLYRGHTKSKSAIMRVTMLVVIKNAKIILHREAGEVWI